MKVKLLKKLRKEGRSMVTIYSVTPGVAAICANGPPCTSGTTASLIIAENSTGNGAS